MWNLVWIILILYIVIKGKKGIAKLWGSLNSDSKLVLVEKPTKYRDYNIYIHLSEIVHWDVMPAMGETQGLIRQDIEGVMKLILESEKVELISMHELVELWERVGTGSRNFELFTVFFKTLEKKVPHHQRYKLLNLVVIINAAV
jgi:hypothetical protein